MPLRVLVAGGGTGGHVIPALAIARELTSRHGAEVEFIGTSRGIETRLVPQSGYPLHLVDVGALNNVGLKTRLRTILDLPRAVMLAAALLGELNIDIVIGVGGYASGPGMLGAILSRVPRIAFEPNRVPGFANRKIARFVSAAAVNFPETARYFPDATVTGVPVRAEFFAMPPRDAMGPPTLLVTGGSQGARALNQVMTSAAAGLAADLPGLHIIHQTGEREFEEVRAAYVAAGANVVSPGDPVSGSASPPPHSQASFTRLTVEVSPFLRDMPSAFARADLLLCRSGASTVAEICAAGKPAIFVPFPHAADDHQKRNAQAVVDRGAAAMIEQAELAPAILTGRIIELLNDPALLARMSSAARPLAHPNAAAEIAAMAARLASKKQVPTK